jgi:hypothetical protein
MVGERPGGLSRYCSVAADDARPTFATASFAGSDALKGGESCAPTQAAALTALKVSRRKCDINTQKYQGDLERLSEDIRCSTTGLLRTDTPRRRFRHDPRMMPWAGCICLAARNRSM